MSNTVNSVATVPAAFAESVRRNASRTAVIAEDGSELSYAELDQLRIYAARSLLALDIKHGDRVAIWAQNCVEWIIAGLAIHSVGAVLVPINTRMKGNEAAYVLEKSGARILFCAGNFLGTHYPSLIAAEHWPKTLEHVIVLRDEKAGDTGWREFMAKADQSHTEEVMKRAAAVTPDDRMDIMFTSGTTGRPKGVVTHHGQNLRVIADWSAHMGLVPEDRYLIANPFFHTFGYKVGWLGSLMIGLTVLPHAIFDAGAILKRIATQRISVLPGPPTLFISLLNDPARATSDLSSLRATITGAATIAPSLIERIRAELGFKIVLTAYGLTETCGVASMCKVDDDAETIALTSGTAIDSTEMRIVDSDNKPVAVGESGEIVIRGYNVMQCYLDDDKATAETIDKDGWLHTGDVGILDARGYLKITDRLKDMYITGGFNCYPAEIERIIAAYPAVAQIAIVGVPDERQGEVGKAFVVARPGQQIDDKEFIAWCREQMANYKVPRSVEVLDALPMNAGGKVMKFELRKKA